MINRVTVNRVSNAPIFFFFNQYFIKFPTISGIYRCKAASKSSSVFNVLIIDNGSIDDFNKILALHLKIVLYVLHFIP